MTEHTPGPYIRMENTETGLPVIVAEDGPALLELTRWTSTGKSDPDVIEANAEFWLMAGNAHEGLVELAAEALHLRYIIKNGLSETWETTTEHERIYCCTKALALAKAEGMKANTKNETR